MRAQYCNFVCPSPLPPALQKQPIFRATLIRIMIKYCFLCLFRADKGASGLAFRIPLIWKALSHDEGVRLIVNRSLAEKTLGFRQSKGNLIVIPEYFGFKLSCLLFVPPVLFVSLLRGARKFHLSVGGAYFLGVFQWLKRLNAFRSIVLHTSIGSRSVEMAVGGNEKYRSLHDKLLQGVDGVDCLYDSSGFPGYEEKFIRSPGSFSWRFSDEKLKELQLSRENKSPIIVFSGTLIPQKNYGLAISGFSKFFANFPSSKARLHIFAPQLTESASKEIEDVNKKAGKDIILFRKSSELIAALAEARIFLSLQNFDNYPSQSLIEAMANGCDVIATDVGETRLLVEEGAGNYLIAPDENALCDALTKAFSVASVWNKNNTNKILAEHSAGRYAKYFYENFVR